MKKTENLKEYNKLKKKESRAKQKALGISTYNPETAKKAQEKFKALLLNLKPQEYESFCNIVKSEGITKIELFRKMITKYMS